MMIATHKGTQQDLAGRHEHLAAELGKLRASLEGRDAFMMAKGVRQAIEATRDSMYQGGRQWLCRVVDLEEWAGRLDTVATAPPEPVEPTIAQKRTQLHADLRELQAARATREITPALASMITGRIMREDAALARCEQAVRIAS